MQKSKKITLIISGLLAIGCFTFAETNTKIIGDPNNAIQHIYKTIFTDKNKQKSYNENKNPYIEGSQGATKIKTDNFLIKSGNNNSITGAHLSSILGGTGNRIEGGTGNTIVGGSNNNINAINSTIGGGTRNIIRAARSTIIGGSGNRISNGSNSTIIGGKNNILSGTNSIVAGSNNKLTGNNSVLIGNNGKLNANNSFLRTDGQQQISQLNKDNTFVVLGKSGMVVKTNKAKDPAQLTIGGSLVIQQSNKDNQIQCNNTTNGVIKLINKDNEQKCFCTCDGNNRTSLIGEGQCEAKCRGSEFNSNKIQCGTTKNTCDKGKFITGSTYIDQYDNIHRACQAIDGTTITCPNN